MSVQAWVHAGLSVDLFFYTQRECLDTEIRTAYDTYLQTPRQEKELYPVFRVSQEARLHALIFDDTKKIFDSIVKALAAQETAIEVGCPRIGILWNQLRANVINGIFRRIFDIRTGFFDSGTLRSFCFASWDANEDKVLRCLLGVPYIVDPLSEEHRWNEYREAGKFTDIILKVEGREFPAHKIILTKTLYFASLFGKNFEEKESSSISIEEVKAEPFETLLQYLYTGEVSLNGRSTDYLIDLARLADKMLAPRLRMLCNYHLVLSLCPENLLYIAQYADSFEQNYLLHACALFLQKNPTALATLDVSQLSHEELTSAFGILSKLVSLCPPSSYHR